MEEKYQFEWTDFHRKYLASQLDLRRPAGSIGALLSTMSNARVDLNPHQVEAALFALHSPLSKGVLLADEVGLGKTIEAGIVILQHLAQGASNILLVVPASLRIQWQSELEEKFGIKSVLVDGALYKQYENDPSKTTNPFAEPGMVRICSYEFASNKKEDLSWISWDLVVFDEAHRLRNVYKANSKIANNIKEALSGSKKLMLTATPLQNNLMELYGLMSILDDQIFPDRSVFRQDFTKGRFDRYKEKDLRKRMEGFCKRTLRRQVNQYINFTKRVAHLEPYHLNPAEAKLSENIHAYIQDENILAIDPKSRNLVSMILLKLLASSSRAMAITLENIIKKFEARIELAQSGKKSAQTDLLTLMDEEDQQRFGEYENKKLDTKRAKKTELSDHLSDAKEELAFLKENLELARSIETDTKAEKLLEALKQALDETERLGGKRKAIIFTEFVRTQEYLYELLSKNGYQGKVLMLNGQNNNESAAEIYEKWSQNEGKHIHGSKATRMKAAIVDAFEKDATILIGTEAASEGINLQFCSLVVNYDLPWNPQRIEQRIGRSHRYGQKNDVVVINFNNQDNLIDTRIYELLTEKLHLFDGVFGSSDEVLGSIEDGVDFEKKILEIYQQCKTTAQIEAAFGRLQKEFESQISDDMKKARQSILENLDEEVVQRFNITEKDTKKELSDQENWTYHLALSHDGQIIDHDGDKEIILEGPDGDQHYGLTRSELGRLDILDKNNETFAHWLEKDQQLELDEQFLAFDGSNSRILGEKKGLKGAVNIDLVDVEGYDPHQKLIITAISSTGKILDEDFVDELFRVKACKAKGKVTSSARFKKRQVKLMDNYLAELQKKREQFVNQERQKIQFFRRDSKEKVRLELLDKGKKIKKSIRENSGYDLTYDEIMKGRAQIEREVKRLHRAELQAFDQELEIEKKADQRKKDIEKHLQEEISVKHLMTFGFQIV